MEAERRADQPEVGALGALHRDAAQPSVHMRDALRQVAGCFVDKRNRVPVQRPVEVDPEPDCEEDGQGDHQDRRLDRRERRAARDVHEGDAGKEDRYPEPDLETGENPEGQQDAHQRRLVPTGLEQPEHKGGNRAREKEDVEALGHAVGREVQEHRVEAQRDDDRQAQAAPDLCERERALDNHDRPVSAHHEGAEIDEAMAIANRGLGGDRFRRLGHRHGFARDVGLLRLEAVGLHDARVRGHSVARLE